MNLQEYNFPNLSKVDLAFSTLETCSILLSEAKERKFYNGNTEYNKTFNHLFFKGGSVVFKENIDTEFQMKAWNYCRSFMRSFAPKHEEKEGICAMLMSELIEPVNP